MHHHTHTNTDTHVNIPWSTEFYCTYNRTHRTCVNFYCLFVFFPFYFFWIAQNCLYSLGFFLITLSQKWRVFLDAKFDLGRQIALRNRVSRLSVWVREQRTKNINMKRNVNVWPRDRLRRFSFQVDGREDVLLCYVFFLHLWFFLAFSSCFTSLSLFLLPLKKRFCGFSFSLLFCTVLFKCWNFSLFFSFSSFCVIGWSVLPFCNTVYHNRMSMDHRI